MNRAKERAIAHTDYSRYDFHYSTKNYEIVLEKGLSEEVVRKISEVKGEPKWMLDFRLRALETFRQKPMPQWGADLGAINFDDITYYMKASQEGGKSWEEVPQDVKNTFERLGIPEAERKMLAGVGAQYDSEVMYHKIRSELEAKGVVFLSMDEGLRQHPEIVREHFGKVVPFNDNKFAALNSAVWSGGSFIYVPKGIKVEIPLQAYFRINAERFGQFERTLIIADEGSQVHYIEGCSAPRFSSKSLHAAVVEVIAKPTAHVRYTTVQNWSDNIYNLVTKRAFAYKNSAVEWVDGNIGSKVTMKYPAIYLMGEGARGEVLSVALAGKGQHQDAGAKVVHLASNTTSKVTSKSISKDGGRTSYRGLVKVIKGCRGVRSNVTCDALLLDRDSRTDTYPYVEIDEQSATIAHEARVGRIGDDQIFYLTSRGLSESQVWDLVAYLATFQPGLISKPSWD